MESVTMTSRKLTVLGQASFVLWGMKMSRSIYAVGVSFQLAEIARILSAKRYKTTWHMEEPCLYLYYPVIL